MGRKAKDPEVRKREFILAAEELFKKQGFEQTSVTDITDKVGVSHGAFFYYFKTRNDIFKAVVAHHLEKYAEAINGIVKDETMSAMEKIQKLLDMTMASTSSTEDTDKFVEYLHAEGNEAMHKEYVDRSYELFVPMITEIVEQGIKNGELEVKYPRETVEYVVHMFDALQDVRDVPQSNDAYYRKIRALEIILAKVFGIKEGSVSLRS